MGMSHRDISGRLGIGLGSVFKYTNKIKITKEQHLILKRRNVPRLTFKQKQLGGFNSPHKFRSIYSKEELLQKIKEFYLMNGRIPLKREMQHYRAYLRLFKKWNNAIKSAGFLPNNVLFTKRWVANDGHICDSLSEKIIDDWLYTRRISHKTHVFYPGSKSFRTDFVVNKYWIEFFGLAGVSKHYDELKERKLKLANNYNLNVIQIYPRDLFPKNKLIDLLGFLLDNSADRKENINGR